MPSPAPATRPGAGIQSLEIGIRVFRTLCGMGRAVTLTELSHAAGMHPAKLHRYLASLVRTGLVTQDAARRYGPDPHGFPVPDGDAAAAHARAVATALLPAACAALDETLFLAGWGRRGPVILHVEEPARPIAVRPTSTSDLPLLGSATGRAFAAFLPGERLAALVPDAAERDGARRALAEVRRRGLARSVGERHRGVVAFSAPVFDRDGAVVFAVTAIGLESSLPPDRDGPVPRGLARLATEIGARIGGAPVPRDPVPRRQGHVPNKGSGRSGILRNRPVSKASR